ncbi:hypothetical protein [Micromonospora mirobrigensis]|uniref:Uncharacterized protein n=1 Tax=Micromonospora mirobrigensis TaxID=262898 RepID=A0A1C4WR20_9ACTN|nr:hypothetical protein [Micromonospora mirobrigensis]SCE98736.1 hypothetical protein GA0070564_102454 [Micromonospora mirobrigensis]
MAFPIDRFLVPETPVAPPAGFTEVRRPLTAGLPQRVELADGTHGVLILPTGLARQWLDADPLAVVSASADESAARPVPAPRPLPAVGARAPLRLVVRQGTRILGSVPLAAGLRRACGPVEVVVLGWHLTAGTVRGAGDYGSWLWVGWRVADRAVDTFGPPPINAFVWRRRPPGTRIESEQGSARFRYRYLVDKKLRRVVR